jgi:hypothetical protein
VQVGGHDLALGAVNGDLVEAEVLTRGTDVVDTTGNADLLVLDLLALLEVTILFLEVAEVVGDLELVRVGREGLLGVLELLDSPAADLEVLLRLLAAHSSHCIDCTIFHPLTLGFN